MPPMFLHRVWLGRGDRDEFNLVTNALADQNPDYTVSVWDQEVLDDFPELSQIVLALQFRYIVRLEDIIGLALVARWGGAYYGRGGVPFHALPVVHAAGPWMVHSGIVGSIEPGDPFWVDVLQEMTGPYFHHLTDTELETLYLRHSMGQLSMYSLDRPVLGGR